MKKHSNDSDGLIKINLHPDGYEPENVIEDHFTNKGKELGFKTYKFKSPGQSGVPDQLLLAKGRTIYVELKATGEKPRRLQKEVIKDIRKQGNIVFVLDSIKDVDELYNRVCQLKTRKDTLDTSNLGVF